MKKINKKQHKTHKHRRTFTQLDIGKRDRLQKLLAVPKSEQITQTEIAAILKVHKSTISREIRKIRKNKGTSIVKRYKPYDSEKAQKKADKNRGNSKYQGMRIEKDKELRAHIIKELKIPRSPDEIAGRMKKEKRKVRVGTDAIYTWLYSNRGQRYCKYLCTKRYKPKKHKPKAVKEMIPHRVHISKRPKTKGLIHAEGDTLVSGKKTKSTAACGVIVIQKTKFLVGTTLANLKPDTMKQGVCTSLQGIHIDTLTLDNGIENRHHEQFGVPSYFCDAYSPWQKPLVEQSIGLLRRYGIKKGSDLSHVSEEVFQQKLTYLNNKYRKSLGYKSAYEASIDLGIITK